MPTTPVSLNRSCVAAQVAWMVVQLGIRQLDSGERKLVYVEKAKGELEKQTSEHGKVESNLRKQLEVAGAAAAQNEAAQKQAQARCAQLEQELTGLRQAHGELNARSATEQAASAEAAKRLKELEERLGQRTAAAASG